jgi:hypothetical protein
MIWLINEFLFLMTLRPIKLLIHTSVFFAFTVEYCSCSLFILSTNFMKLNFGKITIKFSKYMNKSSYQYNRGMRHISSRRC